MTLATLAVHVDENKMYALYFLMKPNGFERVINMPISIKMNNVLQFSPCTVSAALPNRNKASIYKNMCTVIFITALLLSTDEQKGWKRPHCSSTALLNRKIHTMEFYAII